MGRRRYARIELLNERTFDIAEGQSILDASLAAGVPHYHACGGRAQCSTCRVYVERGAQHLSPANAAERALARKMKFGGRVRLACQTRIAELPGGAGEGAAEDASREPLEEPARVQLHRIVRDGVDLDLFVRSGKEGRSLGDLRELALFFLDIRDFTRFAESSLPYDVIHILNRFFALVRAAIGEHGGRVIEVAGDGLYAVFGLDGGPAADPAVAAGLQILDDVARFSAEYTERYFGYRIAVGIGLHFGRVICGHVGIGVDGALSVIGYPVNVAARLQAATKELNNSFVVSKQAHARLSAPPRAAESRCVILRGVREPCSVYLLGKPYK